MRLYHKLNDMHTVPQRHAVNISADISIGSNASVAAFHLKIATLDVVSVGEYSYCTAVVNPVRGEPIVFFPVTSGRTVRSRRNRPPSFRSNSMCDNTPGPGSRS